ncbi:sporozoite surface protein 2 [Folsomia candida]|uniref:sporozoite surface protein 2 n=1 Tax=Folsomia candida TaxID=158441 RepID=UPI000B8F5C6D|nr:sporozoite surface protein 2 [Folsomia candida]
MVGGGGARNTTVNIFIRAGAAGNGCRGLEKLHLKNIEADVNSTWFEMFRSKLNFVADPQQYTVRGATGNAPKHDLTEPIRNWMSEFKKLRKVYVIHVLENPSGPRRTPTTTKHAAPQARPTPSNPQPASTRGGPNNKQTPTNNKQQAPASQQKRPNINGPVGDGKKRGKTPPSNNNKSSSNAKRPKREPSPSVSSVTSRQTTKAPLRPQIGIIHTSSSSPIRPPTNQNQQNESPLQSRNAQQIPHRRLGRPGEDVSLPPPNRGRFPEDDLPNSDNGQQKTSNMNRNQEVLEDNYDASSQCSQDSQDSQDDLAELGIPNEDFKSVFIKNAMDRFSNSQLLKARHSLQQLKNSERNNRWTKWSLMCPYAVTVLRDLFDV